MTNTAAPAPRPTLVRGGRPVDGYVQRLPVLVLSATELHREVARLGRLTDPTLAERHRAANALTALDNRLREVARRAALAAR